LLNRKVRNVYSQWRSNSGLISRAEFRKIANVSSFPDLLALRGWMVW
jgi:hypothetical protein